MDNIPLEVIGDKHPERHPEFAKFWNDVVDGNPYIKEEPERAETVIFIEGVKHNYIIGIDPAKEGGDKTVLSQRVNGKWVHFQPKRESTPWADILSHLKKLWYGTFKPDI